MSILYSIALCHTKNCNMYMYCTHVLVLIKKVMHVGACTCTDSTAHNISMMLISVVHNEPFTQSCYQMYVKSIRPPDNCTCGKLRSESLMICCISRVQM